MNKNKGQIKGYVLNIFSMLSYSFYPAFISVLGLVASTGDTSKVITIGFAIVAAKEIFTFFVYCILQMFKRKISIIEIFKLWGTKQGLLSIFTGILGGPLGYTFLTIGTLIIGANSPDAISLSMAVIVTLLLSRFILKRKIGPTKTIGVFLTIFGSILLLLLQGKITKWSSNFTYGLVFALLTAISWGVEAFLADIIMTKYKKDISPEVLLGIKLSSSSLVSFILLIIVSFSANQGPYGIILFSTFFSDWKLLWKIIVIAISMYTARHFFFKAISTTSAVVTTTTLTLQIVFTPIFIAIFSACSLNVNQNDTSLMSDYRFWLIAIELVVASLLSSIDLNFKNFFRRRIFRIKAKANKFSDY